MIRRLTGRRPTKPWALARPLAIALVVAAAAPASALANGTISGTVTDSVTSSPVSGIWVAASGNGQYVGTFTDSFGNYSVSIPAGTNYTVDFNGTNINPAYVQKHVAGVDVTDGNTTTVSAMLAPSAQITGKVTDATTGLPVQNIDVAVYDTSGAYIENAAPTDSNGNYTLPQLAAGSYRVVFNTSHNLTYLEPWWHDKPDFGSATTIMLAAGQTATADQALARSAQISGTVTDAATGNPLSGVLVEASNSVNAFAGSTFTDAGGHYTLTQLPADSYTVLLGHATAGYQEQWWQAVPFQAQATPVTVAAGQTATGIDAALTSASAPANTTPPTISGTTTTGQTLTDVHGSWTNSPSGYTYQWLRCDNTGASCSPIGGATNQTYLLTSSDAGKTIRVSETAANGSGPGLPATSAATAVIHVGTTVNTTPPAVVGNAVEGQTLLVSPGVWTNSPTSYAYQWLGCDSAGANCVPIAGATGMSYLLTSADVGHTIRVSETASNASGPGAPATSAATAPVQQGPPANTTPPSTSGSAAVGQTIVASPGVWTNNPSSYAYQWQSCDSAGANCSALAGATGQSYTLTAANVGNTIRVSVTATNATGTSSPVASAATAAVLSAPVAPGPAPASSSPPAITGSPVAGQTLAVSQGSWSGNPTVFSHQWQRCDAAGSACDSIAGATGSSYALADIDVGHTIRVIETASNANGSGTPATSSAAGPVSAATTHGPPPPPPELAHSADVYPAGGRVLIELPGSRTFVPLDTARQIPFGATIDATRGTAKLCTAHDTAGGVQCANFWEGEFRIGQRRAHVPITDVRLLGGDFSQCDASTPAARGRRAQAARRRRSHRSVRHLWGNGKGHYRTLATQSATAVRGTYWLTDDRCDGTLTRVRRGVVTVTDYRLHRTVIVRAGQSYLAALP